jgi:hypothetical protein
MWRRIGLLRLVSAIGGISDPQMTRTWREEGLRGGKCADILPCKIKPTSFYGYIWDLRQMFEKLSS